MADARTVNDVAQMLEEKIADLQNTKRELADALLGEAAGLLRTLEPEDLEWLLS